MLLTSFDPTEEFEDMCDDLRNYVLARDECLCLICSKQGFEPHHVLYRSLGGKHCANNLATLCNKCHAKIHNIKDEVKELLFRMIERNENKLRERLV